jgi:hypothetical protein
MSAATTGCSSEGEEKVKAGEGALEAASIVAPARAAIAPWERILEIMVPPSLPANAPIMLVPSEFGMNAQSHFVVPIRPLFFWVDMLDSQDHDGFGRFGIFPRRPITSLGALRSPCATKVRRSAPGVTAFLLSERRGFGFGHAAAR